MSRKIYICLLLLIVSIVPVGSWGQPAKPLSKPKIGTKPKVPSELDRLIAQRDQLVRDGKFQEALPVCERVAALLRNLGPASVELGIALTEFANVQAKLRIFDMSAKNFSEAIEVFKRVKQDESLEAARTWMQWAHLDYDRSLLQESEQKYLRSLSLYRRLDPDSRAVAINLIDLGTVASDRGKMDEAKNLYSLALTIYERIKPDSLIVAASLLGLGAVFYEQGMLEGAQRDFERALALYDRLDPDSEYLAVCLNNLGNVSSDRGRLDDAARYYRRAYSHYKLLGLDTQESAMCLHNLGCVAADQGRWEEARRHLESAISVWQRVNPDSLQMAASVDALGSLAWSGGHLDEAQSKFAHSLSVYKRLAPDSLEVALSLNHLGQVARSRERLDVARVYFTNSLTIQNRLAPNSLGMADVLRQIGDTARKQKDSHAVVNATTRRLKLAQTLLLRESISTGWETGAFGKFAAEALSELGFQPHPETEYQWLVALRGAGLSLLTRAQIAARAVSTKPKLLEAISDVQVRSKLESDWVTEPRPKEMDAKTWDDKLFDLRRQKESAQLKLNTLLKEKDSRMSADLTVQLEGVQAAIPKDATLIEFLKVNTWDDKANKEGPDAYAAFIVHPSGPVKYIKLADAEKVDKEVSSFMSLVDLSTPTKDDEKQRVALGKSLYKELIAPLGKLPANVMVASDGSLHGLAFDALQDNRGRYLVETKSVSLVGGGRDLAVKSPSAPASEPVVIGVGSFDANMDHHGQAVKTVAAKLSETNSVDRGNASSNKWPPLPSAEVEATEVASKLGVAPVLGDEAIEERFLATKNPKVLHLATHGFFYPPAFEKPKNDRMEMMSMGQRIGYADNPMLRSGIVLAGANDEDKLRAAKFLPGWVTALDISLMDLRGTELVVVSACNTGRGEVKLSEGVFGLQRAFKFAGAQSLVMSLFGVPDAATQKLMSDFYGMWKPGAPAGTKQLALRSAKLKLLKDPKTKNPKNWAGFVLIGDR